MPGFNQKGPEGQGPMTGRKMGKCTNFGANNQTHKEIPLDNDQQSTDFEPGMGRGRRRGSGFGTGQGNGMGRGQGRRGGNGNKNRFRGGN